MADEQQRKMVNPDLLGSRVEALFGGTADGCYHLLGDSQDTDNKPISQLTGCTLDPLRDARIELFTQRGAAGLSQRVAASLLDPSPVPDGIVPCHQQQHAAYAAIAGADRWAVGLPLAQQQHATYAPSFLQQQQQQGCSCQHSVALGNGSLLPTHIGGMPSLQDQQPLAITDYPQQLAASTGPVPAEQLLVVVPAHPPSPPASACSTEVQTNSWAAVVQRGGAPVPTSPRQPAPRISPPARQLFNGGGAGRNQPSQPPPPRAKPGCPISRVLLGNSRLGQRGTSTSSGGSMTPPGTPGSFQWQQQQQHVKVSAVQGMTPLFQAAGLQSPFDAQVGTAQDTAACGPGFGSSAGPAAAYSAVCLPVSAACGGGYQAHNQGGFTITTGIPPASDPRLSPFAGQMGQVQDAAAYGCMQTAAGISPGFSYSAGPVAPAFSAAHPPAGYTGGYQGAHNQGGIIITTGVPTASDPRLSPATGYAVLSSPYSPVGSPAFNTAAGVAALLCDSPMAGGSASGVASPCSSDAGSMAGYASAATGSMVGLLPGLVNAYPTSTPLGARAPGSPVAAANQPSTPTGSQAASARSPVLGQLSQLSRLRKASCPGAAHSMAHSVGGRGGGGGGLGGTAGSRLGGTGGAGSGTAASPAATAPPGPPCDTKHMYMEMHDPDCSSYCLGGNLEPHKMWFAVGVHKAIRKLITNNKRRHALILAMHATADHSSSYGDLLKLHREVAGMHAELEAAGAGFANETSMKLWAGVEELLELLEAALKEGPGIKDYQPPPFLR